VLGDSVAAANLVVPVTRQALAFQLGSAERALRCCQSSALACLMLTPWSSMNSTPAASKARLSAASVAGIGRRWPLSNLNIVDAATSERCPRSAIRQPKAARAILLCAAVMVIGAFYEPVTLDATKVEAYHLVTGLTISPVSGSTRCLQRRAEPDHNPVTEQRNHG
jgi:hypothetical protein